MAQASRVDVLFTPSVDPMIDQVLTMIGFGFNPGEMKRACRGEAFRLQAKSDAELRMMGIRRDQIAAHVLRDKFPGVPI